MKKRGLLLAVLPACAAGSAGAGSSGGENMNQTSGAMPEAPAMDSNYWVEAEMDAPAEEPVPPKNAASGGGNALYTGENAKLIQRAELRLQTTDFPAAEASLTALVEAQGGYFESSSVQGGGYYDQQAARYVVYVFRVPKGRY